MNWKKNTDYLFSEARMKKSTTNARKQFAVIELITSGKGADYEFAQTHYEALQEYMHPAALAEWVASQTPPLDSMPNAELRRKLYTKFMEVFA